MAAPDLPPFLQAKVDQGDAELRDLLTEAMGHYRAHAEHHDGTPTPCARGEVMIRHLGILGGSKPLGQHDALGLIAYMVERLFVLERELGRRCAELADLDQELTRLKSGAGQ